MDELEEILLGGQSFSWSKKEGYYEGVLNERVYRISSLKDCENDSFLRSYFDLDYDYDKARAEIAKKDDLLKEAVNKFPTLRILRQDPWTCVISFILSQNNNIKRIKQLYDRLSENYGHEVEKGYYSFPPASELSKATVEELHALRVSFRDKFIVDAVKQHELFNSIDKLPFDEALKELQKVKGIGLKVASCILLFGYHRMEAFPVDVWIKKVLAKYYPGKDLSYFEPYPALCQQYLFSFSRYLKLE